MTETELRQSVVDVMRGWLGWTEANGKFRRIIDLYNTQNPLPRRYPVKYSDEWCAATVTAAGMAAGLQDIIYGECGCGKMIALYEARGLWVEDDAYIPSPGDIIMYDWDDSGLGDNRGNPDHVGVVEQVVGGTITIIEGNKGGAVARRKLAVNGRYIRGYCTPDYAGKAEEDEDMTQEQFDQFMENYLARKAQEQADQPWEKNAIAQAKAAGYSDGQRPRATATRVEVMAMLAAAMGQ